MEGSRLDVPLLRLGHFLDLRHHVRHAGLHLPPAQELLARLHQSRDGSAIADHLEQLGREQRGRFRVRASKGVHVVVPRDRIVSEVAIILRTEKSVLFVIPWGTHWIIGTTDTDWDLDLAHPAASRSDIDYVLGQANRLLADPLTHDDVVGCLLYTSPSPRDQRGSRMPSYA